MLEPFADLESITIPSREAIKKGHEGNQTHQSDRISVAIPRFAGHQQAQVRESQATVEVSLNPKEFIQHIHGETWPTKREAETVVFKIDRYPDITYEREAELEDSDELQNAVAEVWEEMKERWWDEVDFVDELEDREGHTVAVHYEEDEE